MDINVLKDRITHCVEIQPQVVEMLKKVIFECKEIDDKDFTFKDVKQFTRSVKKLDEYFAQELSK